MKKKNPGATASEKGGAAPEIENRRIHRHRVTVAYAVQQICAMLAQAQRAERSPALVLLPISDHLCEWVTAAIMEQSLAPEGIDWQELPGNIRLSWRKSSAFVCHPRLPSNHLTFDLTSNQERAFAKLARAHGLTTAQGLAFLANHIASQYTGKAVES